MKRFDPNTYPDTAAAKTEYSLFDRASSCGCAVYVGGASGHLCGCPEPAECLGVQMVARDLSLQDMRIGDAKLANRLTDEGFLGLLDRARELGNGEDARVAVKTWILKQPAVMVVRQGRNNTRPEILSSVSVGDKKPLTVALKEALDAADDLLAEQAPAPAAKR